MITSYVLTRSTVAQPSTPAIGAHYLVAVAATGMDWAGRDGRIAVYTSGGWRFVTLPVGALLFVLDEDAYYHRNASGMWVGGIGSIAIGASSVPITALIGANASFTIKVENQTTNAPPASPSVPTAYIVGPSPTGAWAGSAGKLAICLAAGSFTIVTPVAGDIVYDKTTSINYQFSGTAWVPQVGVWLSHTLQYTAGNGSTNAPSGSAPYTYNAGAEPTTSTRQRIDGVQLTLAASRAGGLVRVHYSADVVYRASSGGVGAGDLVVALYRDASTAAVDWHVVPLIAAVAVAGGAYATHLDHWFEFAALDAAGHTYTVALTSKYTDGSNFLDADAPTHRLFEAEISG